ncbi:MAG: NrtA/SsuA/CpmA family ABC transporter substrate-binding protein [Synergistaceae bacterium]|jgi:NitT/TauT family transport system substrate-binding protein|nr:NrtA/SsuA/CpmA family ABC transporter substrate-binding protein [Synergistaceae bacterium]
MRSSMAKRNRSAGFLAMTVILTLAILPGYIMLRAGEASALEKVVLAGGSMTQIPQVDVAFRDDLFKEAGLDVEVVSFPSGREGFEALIGGQVDIALMAEFPVAIGAVREQPFALLAELSQYSGHKIIASAKSGDFKNIADLAGKKIGVTIGTNVAYLLESELASAGIAAEIVNVAPPDMAPALVRGDIDAASPFPNVYAAARNALGGEYREIPVKNYISRFVLAVSNAFAERDRETVNKFVAALVKADATVRSDRAEALETVFENYGGVITREQLAEQWEDTSFDVQLTDSLLDLVEKEGTWIAEGTLKQTPPDREHYRRFFLTQPLEKALGRSIEIR